MEALSHLVILLIENIQEDARLFKDRVIQDGFSNEIIEVDTL